MNSRLLRVTTTRFNFTSHFMKLGDKNKKTNKKTQNSKTKAYKESFFVFKQGPTM